MREQIEILASLQNVDREIKEKSSARESLSSEIRKMEEVIEAKKAEVKTLKAEWADKDKRRQEKERLLQEESRKTMEKRMRMNRIKNIKELQALQREIELIKQSNAQMEEELIRLLEELEASGAVLKGKEEELKKFEMDWGDKRKEIEEELARLEQGLEEASELRQNIAAQLDGDLIERYELIFSRRGGTAVVAVAEGICQGCYMNIPPQLCNEIIKGERLILCPSCHRILYYKPADTSGKQL